MLKVVLVAVLVSMTQQEVVQPDTTEKLAARLKDAQATLVKFNMRRDQFLTQWKNADFRKAVEADKELTNRLFKYLLVADDSPTLAITGTQEKLVQMFGKLRTLHRKKNVTEKELKDFAEELKFLEVRAARLKKLYEAQDEAYKKYKK